jgi:hypothetical protein
MKWFKRKEKKAEATYLLDEVSHTCHFFHDCKIKSNDTKAVKSDDWVMKHFQYPVCPTCSERNTKDLNDSIRWMFSGLIMTVTLKEAGLDKDEETLKMVREVMKEQWDKEHTAGD